MFSCAASAPDAQTTVPTRSLGNCRLGEPTAYVLRATDAAQRPLILFLEGDVHPVEKARVLVCAEVGR